MDASLTGRWWTSNSNFPTLENDVIDDLSTDQHYAYRICWEIILGDIDEVLQLLLSVRLRTTLSWQGLVHIVVAITVSNGGRVLHSHIFSTLVYHQEAEVLN